MRLRLVATYSERAGNAQRPRVFTREVDRPYAVVPMAGDTIDMGEGDEQPTVISERSLESDGTVELYFGGFDGWDLPQALLNLGFEEAREPQNDERRAV